MKKIRYYFFLLLGIVLMIDCIVLQFYLSSFNTGVIIPGVVGTIMTVYGYFRIRKNENIFFRLGKFWKRAALVVLIILIVSFIAVETLLLSANLKSSNKKPEYIITLGAGLKGENLSLTLLRRMEKTVEYLRENPQAKVVVSGGKGFDEKIAEAEAMKRYLLKKGIAEERVIKEEKSTSTMENFKFSKEILIKNGWSGNEEVAVVTNEFHMMRARMIAERNGIKSVPVTCSTPYSVIINNFVREYFAVIKTYILDR